jgi:hypothetical protein
MDVMNDLHLRQEPTELGYDPDDPPPSGEWTYWDYFNRWAETLARIMRSYHETSSPRM